MDPVLSRRSCRSFTDEPVDDEDLEALLRAAMAAPSAMNGQPWEFYLTRDPALMERLAATSPYAGPAAKAPVLVVPCYREDCAASEYAQIDMALACENLMVRAEGLGLGTVMLGVAPEADRMEAVARELGLPAGVKAFALFPVGHPARTHAPHGDDVWDAGRVHWV